MKHSDNIFLIGPMGAGKTTIGRQLAKLLDIAFVDSDKEIERKTGAAIPMIFDYEGEEGFRKRETEVLEEITQKSPIVLATGGGAIIQPPNRIYLQERGYVVYLQCDVDTQLNRTRSDGNRPLLKTENPRQRLEELYAFRDPIYRQLADLLVDTGHHSSRSAVRRILWFFNQYRNRRNENTKRQSGS